MVALREGIALAEFDWDPQADDQRSLSLLGESAAAPRSYVLVMSARLPPPGAPPRLAILWGATCGARFGALQPEMPLEPGHMTFSVGRARVIVRWQARAAAEGGRPALPPRVPSAAPSLSFGLAADEEVKLSASLARDGSLAVGAYRTTVRKVRDQLLNAEGELDEGMANALFCCLEARPAHAVLDQDTLALVRERGSQAVVGRLHHAAASAPSIFHLPIHADGRWAYAAASPDGCACLFSTPDSAERIGQTMVSCFEALAAVRWRSLTKPFDPRSDSALQSLLAHALTMRCDSAASLEAVDLSTVDAHSARRWLASRLVESAQFVAEGPRAADRHGSSALGLRPATGERSARRWRRHARGVRGAGEFGGRGRARPPAGDLHRACQATGIARLFFPSAAASARPQLCSFAAADSCASRGRSRSGAERTRSRGLSHRRGVGLRLGIVARCPSC